MLRLMCFLVFLMGLMSDNSVTSEGSFFHCGRTGQNCSNGTCDIDYGQCHCPANFTGHDCSLDMTKFTTDNCSLQCHYGGFCYKNVEPDIYSFEKCFCPPDRHGRTCEAPIVYFHCSSSIYTHVEIALGTNANFNGIVFIGDYDASNEQCTIRPIYGGYYERILSLEDCNSTTVKEPGYERYVFQMTIQYDPVFQSALDLTFNLTCIHLTDGTWDSNNTLYVSKTPTEKQQGKEVKDTYFPVNMVTRGNDEQSINTNNLVLGQRVTINFEVYDDSFDALALRTCTFSNLSGSKKITVISNGCPTDRSLGMALSVHDSRSYYAAGRGLSFNIIRFGTDRVLRVACQIQICKRDQNTTACDQPECGHRAKRDVDLAMSRSRRDTPEASQQTLSKSFTVLDLDSQEARDSLVNPDSCLQQPMIRTAAISMICLLLLLFLVCLVLAICMCRLRVAGLKKAQNEYQ